MSIFKLPDLGEGLQEAEIVAWHVSPGDHVVADQPLVSVETDKAVVEIPAPASGRIKAVHGTAGDIVAVGATLAEIEDAAEEDTGAVVGELPRAEPAPKPAPAPADTRPRPVTGVRAAPAIRSLARTLGVDLAGLTGTGPDGAITSDDVHAASGDAAAGPGTGLRGARRAMARTMERSGREVVPATVQDVADISRWQAATDPTLRLIRAIAAGVSAEPGLNAWFDGHRLALTRHETIDLGIAMDTADGLFVPVLRDVAAQDDAALRARLDELRNAVAARTIAREDLTGQTFTLSNFGMIAGEHVSLVVVPPQVAILGAGRIHEAPVIHDGEVRIGRILPLSLTFDHRAVTGGEAARFLAAVIADLEDPRKA